MNKKSILLIAVMLAVTAITCTIRDAVRHHKEETASSVSEDFFANELAISELLSGMSIEINCK